MKQWPLNGLIVRYLDMPGQLAASYKWKSPPNAISLVINLGGAVDLQIEGHEKPIIFKPDTCNLFYAVSAEGQVINRDGQHKMLTVQFEAAYFLQQLEQFNLSKMPFAQAVKSQQPVLLLSQSAPVSLALGRISADITNLQVDEKYRPLMLAAKAPELLLYMLDLFDKTGTKKWVHCKTPYDRERLEFARTYLLGQVANPPGLTELSRIAGINQLKLKMGFKEVFGQTVFGYLNEYRLEKAQQEIKQGGKPLAQIAFELGFSSPQHFSMAYKKKFGRAPGKSN